MILYSDTNARVCAHNHTKEQLKTAGEYYLSLIEASHVKLDGPHGKVLELIGEKKAKQLISFPASPWLYWTTYSSYHYRWMFELCNYCLMLNGKADLINPKLELLPFNMLSKGFKAPYPLDNNRNSKDILIDNRKFIVGMINREVNPEWVSYMPHWIEKTRDEYIYNMV